MRRHTSEYTKREAFKGTTCHDAVGDTGVVVVDGVHKGSDVVGVGWSKRLNVETKNFLLRLSRVRLSGMRAPKG